MKEKISFLDRIVIAVTKPKEYHKFPGQNTAGTIGFVFLLSIVLSLVGYAYMVRTAIPEMNEFVEQIGEIPVDAYVKDGKLVVNTGYVLDKDGIYISISADKKIYTAEDIPAGTEMAILFGESVVVVYSQGYSHQFAYTEIEGLVINKEFIERIAGLFNGAMIATVIVGLGVYYVVTAVSYFVYSALTASISMLFCTFRNYRLSFKASYMMSLYAWLVPSLVKALNACIGYLIPNDIMNYLAIIGSLVYMYFAVTEYMQIIPAKK